MSSTWAKKNNLEPKMACGWFLRCAIREPANTGSFFLVQTFSTDENLLHKIVLYFYTTKTTCITTKIITTITITITR